DGGQVQKFVKRKRKISMRKLIGLGLLSVLGITLTACGGESGNNANANRMNTNTMSNTTTTYSSPTPMSTVANLGNTSGTSTGNMNTGTGTMGNTNRGTTNTTTGNRGNMNTTATPRRTP